MSLVPENDVSTVLIYLIFKLFWYHSITVTLFTRLFLFWFLLLDTMIWWCHCHFKVFCLLTPSDCSQNFKYVMCVFLFCVHHIFCHFHNCAHPATAWVPLFCSFYTFHHCTMLYCPNPSCTRNLGNTKKPFHSDKSFKNHVQQSPKCKPFVFDQSAVIAPSLQAPSKNLNTHHCSSV